MSHLPIQQTGKNIKETVNNINQLIKGQGLCIWDPNLGKVRSCFELENAVQIGNTIYINISKTKQRSQP